jgi:hypothetical protein
MITAKYSNTKEPIAKLVIDKKSISRNNTILVTFQCPTCQTVREITLNLFMRRVSRDTKTCYCCVNKNSEKCQNQSEFMKQNMSSILEGTYTKKEPVSKKTLEEYLNFSDKCWEKEDIEFQNHYNLKHISLDDFEGLRGKIKGIGNGKLTDLKGWIYFHHYRIFNQTRYTPMLIDVSNQIIEKPQYVTFECENCGCHFNHRDLEIVKNKRKLFCQQCSLTNRTFHLRSYKMRNGSCILWQSHLEKKFIEWCEQNSISIQNGPVISYVFQEKSHKYRVDFELPQYKMLIEMKDNHCWHQAQVANGKFGEKEKAAIKWSEENNYTFHIVFPKTLQVFKNSILQRSL